MKRFIALLLTLALALGAASMLACSDKNQGTATPAPDQSANPEQSANPAAADFKVGVILIGDENEGYTYAHIEGIEAAKKANGLKDDQIIYKYNVPEDQKCYDAAIDLVEQGCKIIFANSFGHESYMIQAAKENPDVLFCHATGQTAAKQSDLKNIFNYFTSIYEPATFPASLPA